MLHVKITLKHDHNSADDNLGMDVFAESDEKENCCQHEIDMFEVLKAFLTVISGGRVETHTHRQELVKETKEEDTPSGLH